MLHCSTFDWLLDNGNGFGLGTPGTGRSWNRPSALIKSSSGDVDVVVAAVSGCVCMPDQ